MIIAKLMGGLGNQMFQYAAARSLASEKATCVYLDPSFLYEDSKGRWTQREYELGVFNIQYKFERSGRINFLRKLETSPSFRKAAQKNWWPFRFRHFAEPDSKFHPEIFSYPSNTYLHGYFQSEKYFEKYADTIRKDFEFIAEPNEKNAALLAHIRSVNSISIHVRRGDYVTLKSASEFHGMMSLDYYNTGVAYIINKIKQEPEFFIFSDDPEWVKNNLKLPGKTTYIDWNTGKAAAEDLRLMSNCKHHIIANSSFSWWGAWL
ncbi:MAG: alpha-1,2-fucosyltransferase, partial [Bacteroidia bacterium]